MAENKKKVKEFSKGDYWGCASICVIILSFCIGGLVGGFLAIATLCVIYGVLAHKKGKEKQKLLAEIELRTSDLIKVRKLFEETDVANVELKKKLVEANENIENLLKIKERYQGIIDTEEEIKRLKAETNNEIEKQRNDAKYEIESEKANAKRDVSILEEKIVKLSKEKRESEELLTAIRNSIEGYGTQYIKPSYTLLDELAEGFGHTEAGAQLKVARKKSILMTKDGSAVECEYPSDGVAVKIKSLVLDAFDFRVDSILAKVKKIIMEFWSRKLRMRFLL